MLAHGFAITYLPQKLEEHHHTTERSDRSLRLAQFHFFSAPKSGNFPMHCFVLLGVSFIQLKLNRVRAKQCYSISEFRLCWRTHRLARCLLGPCPHCSSQSALAMDQPARDATTNGKSSR